MRLFRWLSLLAVITTTVGCQYGVMGKRRSELCCPTDIRQTHTWVFGEDAIIWGPCGLSEGSYGYKATSWRDFPMAVDDWRSASAACTPESIDLIAPNSSSTETIIEPSPTYHQLLPLNEGRMEP